MSTLESKDGIRNVEVDATHKAARFLSRPMEHVDSVNSKIGGHFRLSHAPALLTGLAANAPVYAWRWTDSNFLCVVKRIELSCAISTAFTTAQVNDYNLIVARAYTASDTGGNSILPTGNSGKMRTANMSSTLLADVRVSSGATLTAGTRTLDGQPLANVAMNLANVLGQSDVRTLYDWANQDAPLILSNNEGFIIRNTAALGAVGVVSFAANVTWVEVPTF